MVGRRGIRRIAMVEGRVCFKQSKVDPDIRWKRGRYEFA